MESNKRAREQIFEIINNQMMANNPPETKLTFERLKILGCSDMDTKKYIGQCLALELFQVLKYKEPFDLSRYTSNLNKLTEEPFDD